MVKIKKDDVVYHEKWGWGIVQNLKNTSDLDNIMASVIFDKAPITKKGNKEKRAIHVSSLVKRQRRNDDLFAINETKGWSARIDELVKRDMIIDKERDGLKALIHSPDKENAVVAEEIVKLKIEDVLRDGLNNCQIDAFNSLVDYIQNDTNTHDAFVLKGYAGTGKTYLIGRIIQYIMTATPRNKIAVTAPTNKAVRVAATKSPYISYEHLKLDDSNDAKNKIKYATIHSLLGLKQQVDNKGNQSWKPDSTTSPDISNYKVLIVDEVSMLDDELCELILQTKKLKIIFMGDPAQIPPIGKPDCIPFKDDVNYNFKKATLEQIMRQKDDNSIIEQSFIIRKNLKVNNPINNIKTKINSDGHGVIRVDYNTEKDKVIPLLKKYFVNDDFRNDADYMKVIGWRNVKVNYYNSLVRSLLYGDNAERFEVGEKLIANSPIFRYGVFKQKGVERYLLDYPTSTEFHIKGISIANQTFEEGMYRLNCNVYKLDVYYINNKGEQKKDFVTVIHEDDQEWYQRVINQAKHEAIKSKQARAWVTYYNVLKWSADVGYNYAITAHKAQGSTYTNTLLLEYDIDVNTNIVERNRIKYTAYTRASEKLFILK
jgi:hypothetical protein